jgi:hypothetical protein
MILYITTILQVFFKKRCQLTDKHFCGFAAGKIAVGQQLAADQKSYVIRSIGRHFSTNLL